MEISELISNPLVWGLLVWLFSRIFSSKKEEEVTSKEQPSKPKTPPNQLPRQRRSDQRRQTPKSVMTTVEQPSRKENATLQTVQEAYEGMKAQSVEQKDEVVTTHRGRERTNRLKDNQRLQPKVNRNINQNSLKMDKQKAIQGVIWSEILGAPRSKNPHYTRKRRHS